MVRRFRSSNDFQTNLNGAVTVGATTWTVDSVSGFPTEGDFYVTAGSEIALVTHVSGFNLTVIRGQEGTTAAAHNDGVGVAGIATAGEFYGRMKDEGEIKCLPYGRCMKADGTILTASDFTLRNTGTGTAVFDGNDGTIVFTAKDMSGNDTTGATRDFGTATDHRITVHLACPALAGENNDMLSFYSRQSSGGTVDGMSLRPHTSEGLSAKQTVDQRSTFLVSPIDDVAWGTAGRMDFWGRLEIEWDVVASTDHLRWYFSADGVHWNLAHTHTFASSTCQVGIWMTNLTGTIANMRSQILSWYEETLTF